MRRLFSQLISVVLCLFLFTSMGCSPSQKPISDNKGVGLFMKQVEDSAERGRWQEANSSVKKLEAAWKRDRDRLTTTRTRQSVNKFEGSLKELKEEVQDRDKEDVAEEIASMRNHYRKITAP